MCEYSVVGFHPQLLSYNYINLHTSSNTLWEVPNGGFANILASRYLTRPSVNEVQADIVRITERMVAARQRQDQRSHLCPGSVLRSQGYPLAHFLWSGS